MRISDWSSDVCSSDLQYQFSLEQLSQRTGLTKSYLSKLERGVSEPSISTVLKLAQAYEIGVSQLIGTGEGGESEAISVVRRNEREPPIGKASCRERVCKYG